MSSGEKTRGTTPPSAVRNTRFSATASLAMEVSRSDESQSTRRGKSVDLSINASLESSFDGQRSKISVPQSEENQPDVSHTRGSKRASPAGGQTTTFVKRRRVPLQIKIVRKSGNGAGSRKKGNEKPKNARRSSRKKEKVDEDEDDFDFESANPAPTRGRRARKV